MSNESKKSSKVKAFCTGGIPGFEWILKTLQDDKSSSSAKRDSSIKLIKNLKACNELCIKLIDYYPSWSAERQECIQRIQTIADKIDTCHGTANKVQLPAAGLGILSGALVITGLALTPVTFGASLGLTIAGTAVGVASASTGAGASVTDVVVTRKKVKEAHECFEQHKLNTVKLIEMISGIVQITDEIDKLSNEETIEYLQTVMTQNDGSLAKAATFGFVSNVKSMYNFVYSIPEAVVALKRICLAITTSPLLQGVISIVPTQISGAVAGVSAQAAGLTAKLGGQTLVAFSYIGGALGIAASAGIAAYTIYDMVKKENKTDAANKLRELCKQLDEEHVELEQVHQTLLDAMGRGTESTATSEELSQEEINETSEGAT